MCAVPIPRIGLRVAPGACAPLGQGQNPLLSGFGLSLPCAGGCGHCLGSCVSPVAFRHRNWALWDFWEAVSVWRRSWMEQSLCLSAGVDRSSSAGFPSIPGVPQVCEIEMETLAFEN